MLDPVSAGNPIGRIRTVRLIYFMAGMGASAWAITVPFAKMRFGLNDATLGLILLASGSGGVVAMPAVSYLVGRIGSRTLLLAAGILFSLVLPLLTIAPSVPAFVALLFAYGVTFAAIDIGMNAQAVVTETKSGRLLMSSFHALFSIGSLAIAVATSLLLKLGLTNATCATLCAACMFAILTQTPRLQPKREDMAQAGPAFALPDRATILLGLCCFACFLTEGAVMDWSTILLHFSRHLSLAGAALGYAGFAIAMAAARLAGDSAGMKFGKPTVMRLGSLTAGAGMVLVTAIANPAIDIIGFTLVGLGIGNVAPLVFSAGAKIPGISPNLSVPAIVSLGYLGFIIGPVIIGFVANATTLPIALALNALMLFALALAAGAVA